MTYSRRTQFIIHEVLRQLALYVYRVPPDTKLAQSNEKELTDVGQPLLYLVEFKGDRTPDPKSAAGKGTKISVLFSM